MPWLCYAFTISHRFVGLHSNANAEEGKVSRSAFTKSDASDRVSWRAHQRGRHGYVRALWRRVCSRPFLTGQLGFGGDQFAVEGLGEDGMRKCLDAPQSPATYSLVR